MSSHAVTWLFGKMPTHGDFVSRGLAPDTRDVLDRWLSDEMIRARQHVGAAFESAYDSASPWLWSDGGESGAICPSMDSAGRRFPILVGRAVGEHEASAGVARACENAIYRALGEGLTADQLQAAIGEELPSEGEAAPMSNWWRDANDRFPAAHIDGSRPSGLVAAMLADFVDG